MDFAECGGSLIPDLGFALANSGRGQSGFSSGPVGGRVHRLQSRHRSETHAGKGKDDDAEKYGTGRFLFGILVLLLATGGSRADTLNNADALVGSACASTNREAIEWMSRERPAEAANILSRMLVQTGDVPGNRLCRAVTLTNMANAMLRSGRLDEAARAATDAADLAGRDNRAWTALLYEPKLILAQFAVQQRHGSQALRLLNELDSIPGASAREMAVRFGLEAFVVAEKGEFKRAEALARRSVEEWQRTGLFGSLDALSARTNLAMIHLHLGSTSAAVGEIEDCLRVLDRNPCSPILATGVLLTAAGVLWSSAPREAEVMLSRVVTLLPDVPEPIRREDEFLTCRLQEMVFRRMHRREEAKQARRHLQALGIDAAALTVDLSELGSRTQRTIAKLN